MKRLKYNIWILSIVCLMVSCTNDDSLWKDVGTGSIKLQVSDGLLLSRAADNPTERAIKHLDVFIYDENHNNLIYEHINNPATSGDDSEGTVTLRASLSDFKDRIKNFVYVIANAKATFAGNETWDALKAKIQDDLNIHMTGTGLPNMPTHFLMDGIATDGNNSSDGSVQIDSESQDDITLNVILERAAAKVEVTLNQGLDYKFLQDASNSNRGYYFRNMPYKTTLLGRHVDDQSQVYPNEDYLRTPDKANDQQSFNWGADKVVVTGYMYSHKWFNRSLEGGSKDHYYQTGTSLIVNIPLWKDENSDNVLDDGDEIVLNSYYQIPIVKEVTANTWQINRNTLYKVEAIINAPGAEDNKTPHTLQGLKYQVEEWNSKTITVGNQVQPKYLEVNKNMLEMHNVNEDATLEFTSSSTIQSVSISNAYYINKYGNKVTLANYSSNGMSTSFDNSVLKGAITVKSNVPTNFTARYFTLTVTNMDGETETIDVVQYPVICVSNQLGWYSYREDFKNNQNVVMTYENRYNGGIVGVDAKIKNWNEYDGNEYYSKVDGFFKSKVRGNSNSDGTYRTYYYTGTNPKAEICENDANVRIYRIDVKATSAEYVVGKPRLVDGKTDSSLDNQKMVSPSFMIASRLGIMHQGTYNLSDLSQGGAGGMQYNKGTKQLVKGSINWRGQFVAADDGYDMNTDEQLKALQDHCANYVEVVEGTNGSSIVYDNWRLPTAAEVQFIIDTQGTGTNSEAIDYLLNGGFYYSACGPIYNSKRNNSNKFARCVRDVY